MLRIFCAGAIALTWIALASDASAQETRLQIGPLHAGMSVSDVVAALPEAEWIETRGTPSGRLLGARAQAAVAFDNAVWDVAIGRPEQFGGDVSDDVNERRNAYTNAYELRFEREFGPRSTRECRAAFNSVVIALERVLGPFGMDPQFPDGRSSVYGNPYGDGMRIQSIGMQSRMRLWPRNGMQPMYTFREPSPGFPYRTGAGLDIWDDDSCTVKFYVFQMPPPPDSAAASVRYIPESPRTDNDGRPVYEAPPAALRLPASLRIEDVRAARGNIAAWRNVVRGELGPYNEGTLGTRNVPGVSGYFASFGEGASPPGIIHGRWSDPDSGVDEPSRLAMMPFVTARSLCDARVLFGDSTIAGATYLGANWRPEYEALDAALQAGARPAAYPTLAPNATVLFASSPTGDEVMRFYPAEAMSRGVDGRVTLSCLVQEDHTLRCGVADAGEGEFAEGFAQSALRVMQNPRVRVAAEASNGEATAGRCITRTISFRTAR